MTRTEAPARFTPPKAPRAGSMANPFGPPRASYPRGPRPSTGVKILYASDGTGRCVGMLDQRGGVLVLTKRVSAAKHFLKCPPAICWDSAALREAEQAGASLAEVFDEDRKRTFSAPLSAFREHGFDLDRGHGLQRALALKHWHISDPAQRELCFAGGER